ncbi:MAG: hypothetical protein U1F43_30130 [Myxococcota bacterium]
MKPHRAIATLFVLFHAACDAREIPAHLTSDQVRAEMASDDPTRFLDGGERVFFDDFERAELGPRWSVDRIASEPNGPDWRIEGGWVRGDQTKNQGLWAEVIPDGPVRVEVVMKSLTPAKGKFAGDIKFEAFATAGAHEKGYSFINGGWSNQFDTIAKLGEHSADDRRAPAHAVEANKSYRYAAVRTTNKVYFFRDRQLLYTFDDAAPIQGHWLALNNWLSSAAFGEVAVFKLPAK